MCNEIQSNYDCLTSDELEDLIRQRLSEHLRMSQRAYGFGSKKAFEYAFEDLQEEFKGYVDFKMKDMVWSSGENKHNSPTI